MLDNLFRFIVSGVVVLFLLCLWLACVPRSEEDKIREINRRIAPDGYLTKTHLYIHWPAVYTQARRNDQGDKEIVKAITLKIPIEYLGQNLITFDNVFKMRFPALAKKESSVIDYSSRINEALSIRDHQITSIYLRFQPGAKPDIPMLPYKSDPPDVARKKLEHFQNSYAAHIKRNYYFFAPKNRSALAYLSRSSSDGVSSSFREGMMSGLERYVWVMCYDIARLIKEYPPKTQQRAFDYIASKATDDHSPGHCYEDRANQTIVSPPENFPSDKAISIRCGESLFCDADFGLKNRSIQLVVAKENSIIKYKRKIIKSRDPKVPFKPFPQPLLSEVWTDLPKWREKVEPTQALLNSFLLLEDSPEINGIFYNK